MRRFKFGNETKAFSWQPQDFFDGLSDELSKDSRTQENSAPKQKKTPQHVQETPEVHL